jgi:hypothetical protein
MPEATTSNLWARREEASLNSKSLTQAVATFLETDKWGMPTDRAIRTLLCPRFNPLVSTRCPTTRARWLTHMLWIIRQLKTLWSTKNMPNCRLRDSLDRVRGSFNPWTMIEAGTNLKTCRDLKTSRGTIILWCRAWRQAPTKIRWSRTFSRSKPSNRVWWTTTNLLTARKMGLRCWPKTIDTSTTGQMEIPLSQTWLLQGLKKEETITLSTWPSSKPSNINIIKMMARSTSPWTKQWSTTLMMTTSSSSLLHSVAPWGGSRRG